MTSVAERVGLDHRVEVVPEFSRRLNAIQRELLGLKELPKEDKTRLEQLFEGSIIPTDGDTFFTFSNPFGGFLTVDQLLGGELRVAWHENRRPEKGRAEVIKVSFMGATYKEYDNLGNSSIMQKRSDNSDNLVLKTGTEALAEIDLFRARRLRGETP